MSPYMIGSCDERISTRFRNVFMNLNELDSNGKIVPRPDFAKDDSLHQKFTHLLEELNSRGGVQFDLVEEARKPILKYFENGDPIAVKLFDGFKPPSGSYLVKYSRREVLEPLLNKGIVRICRASYYQDSSHMESIHDSETERYFVIPTFRERLQNKTSIEFQEHTISFGHDDIVIPVVVPDYFMYSLCNEVYYRLPTDFEADAALVIHDQNLFAQRLISTFLASNPEWEPYAGDIAYYDPFMDHTKVRVPEMTKHFGYSYQREYRIAFRSKTSIKTQLEPQLLNIGPMTDYAQLLYV